MLDKTMAVFRFFGLLLWMMVLPLLVGILGSFNVGMGWQAQGGVRWFVVQGVETLLFCSVAGAAVYWFARIYRQGGTADYFQPLSADLERKKLFLSAGYLLALLALGPLYEAILGGFGIEAGVDNLANQQTLLLLTRQMPLLMTVYIVLLAPLLEELLLRGILFQCFTGLHSRGKRSVLLAVSAFIFGSLHSLPVHYDFLLYFAMGLVLGAAYLHTKNLKYSIFIHMINNMVSLVSSFWPE